MENKKKKELKKFTYGKRITKKQYDLLKKNESIKKELDKIVDDYINIYLE